VDKTQKVPLFPLGVVLLPEMLLPLHIFEERYKQMISECLKENTPFGIVLFDGTAIRSVGCMAAITEVTRRYDDGRMDIITEGRDRFVIHEMIEEKPYMEARVVFFDDEDEISVDDVRDTLEIARQQLKEMTDADFLPEHTDLFARTRPKNLAFAIAALEGFTPAERQRFLEMTSGTERLKKSVQALSGLVQRARLTKEILRIIGGNGHPPEGLIKIRE
jgi:ATP-dependent Lon protease